MNDANETLDEMNKRLGVDCPKENYHWAEYKSSALVKNLIDNLNLDPNIHDFWKKIAETLLPAGNFRDDVINQFIDPRNRVRSNQYPIGGYLNFLFNQIDTANPPMNQQQKNDIILGNIFASYNLIRWYGVEYVPNPAVPAPLHYQIFQLMFLGIQTPISRLIQYTRGKRVNFRNREIHSSQIGITRLKEPLLSIDAIFNRNNNHPMWKHTGNETSECRMKYTGQYGAKIREAREKNDPKGRGSLQCGISGSAQFTLFFILTAYACNANLVFNVPDTNSPPEIVFGVPVPRQRALRNDEIFLYMFLTAMIFLIGDGGHNMYEILYGLTISITTLNFLFNPPAGLNSQQIFRNMMIAQGLNNGDVTNFVNNNLNRFLPIITGFNQIVQNVNPILDFTDMTAINTNTVQNYILNDILSQNFIYDETAADYQQKYDMIIAFFGIMNNHYQRDENDADQLILSLVSQLNTKGLIDLPSINNVLRLRMNRCDTTPGRGKTDYAQEAAQMIFAFKKSRKSRKSIKKSKKSVKKSRKSVKKSKKSVKKSVKKSRKSVKKSKKSVRKARK